MRARITRQDGSVMDVEGTEDEIQRLAGLANSGKNKNGSHYFSDLSDQEDPEEDEPLTDELLIPN